MQGHVEEVVLDNFKSYEGQVRVGPFKKFTCIVGPNGAGKSNLMDAVSFVLGVRTRHLRGDRLQDLVHRREDDSVDDVAQRRCLVELVYRFDAPQEGCPETKTFRRVIQPSTEARYQIDGQAVSQEAYLASLEEINILSKARNFLVFQGDIEAAAHRQGKDLTAFFEQVSGSAALSGEYEKLASEKAAREDKARDLYTRKRDAQHEKKRMAQQKEEAEKYQEMESEHRGLQTEFILFQLLSTESVAEDLSKGIAETRREAEAVEADREAAQQKLGDADLDRLEASQAAVDAERLLSTARSELEQLSPEQSQVRAELQSAQRRHEELSTRAELDDQRRIRLESQASDLRKKLEGLEAELDLVRQEARKELPLSPEQMEQFRQAQEETERLTSASSQEARELEVELRALAKRRAAADRGRREAAQRTESLQQKVEDLRASAQSARALHESSAAEAAQKKGEVQELAGKCQALRESRRQLESERRQICEEIQDITATERQIEMERRLTRVCTDLSHAVPGVFGRVVKLCNPVQKRFRVAVNVALNGHLDAVVTQTVDGARSCVQHLKDGMMAPLTFLPLDNLKSMVMDRRLHEALQGRMKLRAALSCISFESSLSRAFDFLLSDVVIADSLDDGREFVFGVLKELGLKCRVVTLSGEVISRDGNLAVKAEGAQPGATRFDFNALEATRGRLEVLQTQLAELSSGVAQAEAAKAAVEEEARRLEAKENDNQLCVRQFEVEVQARQQELGESVAAAERLPTAEALSEEEQRLRERLVTVEESVSAAVSDRFAALSAALNVDDVRRLERDARLNREAAQYRESALSQQLQSFKAELTMIEWALEGRRVQGVPQRARECEVELQILRKRAEEIEKRREGRSKVVEEHAAALQEKRELERNQEQACSRLRMELKDKERAATQAERQLATLSAELAAAREARFELLRKSVLEDIALPFGGPLREAKNAAKKLSSLVADLDASSPAEAAAELRVDFSKLPQAKRKAATGGPATKLLEDEYRAELRRLAVDLEQLKPNLKALAQLEAMDQEALHAEREAQRARKRVEEADRSFETVRTARREKFMGCFRKVQDEIQHVYKRLTKATAKGFEGGAAFLDLEDLEDPWNGGVKFTAMPPAKRFCDIALLSGGEKTVAAMALLFAMQSFQRPPFLILDEVDAYLDHSNVQALASYIASVDCQAIVISHKHRFFSHGEGLVGVSRDRVRNASVVFTMDLERIRRAGREQRAAEVVPLQ